MRPAGSTPTIRPSNRPRTSSMTSSNSGLFGGSISYPIVGLPTASASFPSILPDNSQTSLEKVISSRLVETFIAITIPPPSKLSQHAHGDSVSSSNSFPQSRPSTPSRGLSAAKATLKHSSVPSSGVASRTTSRISSSPTSKHMISPRKESSPSRQNAAKSAVVHTRAASTSSLSPNKKNPIPSSSISKPRPPRTPPSPAPRQSPNCKSSVPNYLSPIHRPSTNPSFTIDPMSKHDFAEWTDLSSDQMNVEIWGRVGNVSPSNSPGRRKGKGKEAEEQPITENNEDWKVLEEWNVKLADLIPLPKDVSLSFAYGTILSSNVHPQLASRPSHLPSNTLLITMSPSGQTYYLPHPTDHSTRASSPGPGYNSDPESAVKNVRPYVGDIFTLTGVNTKSGSRKKSHRRRGGDTQKDATESAGWQDLFKSVLLISH
jgi:UV radiation resistance-associated gene protein